MLDQLRPRREFFTELANFRAGNSKITAGRSPCDRNNWERIRHAATIRQSCASRPFAKSGLFFPTFSVRCAHPTVSARSLRLGARTRDTEKTLFFSGKMRPDEPIPLAKHR